MKISALLPVRGGSKRVLQKNTRPFAEGGSSLLEIKLRQLAKLDFLHEIVLSTDDLLSMELATKILGGRAKIVARPPELCLDSTLLDDLIEHMGANCSSDYFLWTHVTSPFFGTALYRSANELFSDAIAEGHDSLLAVEPIQDFMLFRGAPLNFGNATNFWPRTQDLEPVHRVTSSLFMGHVDLLTKLRNRIGEMPVYFEVAGIAAVDIDWPEDFENAALQLRIRPDLVL